MSQQVQILVCVLLEVHWFLPLTVSCRFVHKTAIKYNLAVNWTKSNQRNPLFGVQNLSSNEQADCCACRMQFGRESIAIRCERWLSEGIWKNSAEDSTGSSILQRRRIQTRSDIDCSRSLRLS